MGLIKHFPLFVLIRRVKVNRLNPVCSEFIEFLEVKGLDNKVYNLKEGYYWLDRMIIRALDIEGNEHKIVRIHVDKDFEVTFSDYPNEEQDFEIESWKDTALRHKERLLKLESKSIEDVKMLLEKFKDNNKYICHSGGKDSTVLNHVVRKVDSGIPILFNNTSNESAETYKLIKSLDNVRTLNPKEGFWQYIKRTNFVPSRMARSCCGLYKHDLTSDNLNHDEKYLLFMGMRNAESNTRSGYETIHSFDYYPEDWTCGLAIRKWKELDIWLYIILNDLRFNDIYRMGYSRCGCIVCGFRSNLEELMTTHFFPKTMNRFETVQENNFLAHERWIGLHCTLDEFKNKGAWKGGLYRPEPTQEVIQEFADYKGLDYDIAEKFFSRKCKICDKNIRQKNVLAMNLKYLGRNAGDILCKTHLQEHLSEIKGSKFTNQDWKDAIKDFESDGCELF